MNLGNWETYTTKAIEFANMMGRDFGSLKQSSPRPWGCFYKGMPNRPRILFYRKLVIYHKVGMGRLDPFSSLKSRNHP